MIADGPVHVLAPPDGYYPPYRRGPEDDLSFLEFLGLFVIGTIFLGLFWGGWFALKFFWHVLWYGFAAACA